MWHIDLIMIFDDHFEHRQQLPGGDAQGIVNALYEYLVDWEHDTAKSNWWNFKLHVSCISSCHSFS